MCGIFGYIGKKDPLNICLKGLEQLEYRGYDSSGIGGIHNGKISICKKQGKLSNLKEKLTLPRLELAIAHTRWATHGKVTDENAHPFVDASESVALIHNGIIENYKELKEQLLIDGVKFSSETDSEVVANLIAKFYKGNLLQAMHSALKLLKGSFAFLAIHKDHPDEIIAAANQCPLSIGRNENKQETVISSDPNAFEGGDFDIFFLLNGEVARVQKGEVEIFDQTLNPIQKKGERLLLDSQAPSKDGFDHFMLKEIFQQPQVLQKALLGRYLDGIFFEECNMPKNILENIKNIWIFGCGTSAHAGLIGSYFLEELALFPTTVEIASEARYRDLLIDDQTLVLSISQSGETADTIAAMREAQGKNCHVLGVCNVKNSTIARDANSIVYLKAGPEISVCSTKAFTAQIMTLLLFALQVAERKKTKSKEDVLRIFQELHKIPLLIQKILLAKDEIQKIAKKYAHFNDFIFLGRRYMVPTAMEAALKLKEISYVNANSYPAGELKHGPIALLNPNLPVIAFCANSKTKDKMISNLMEVKARNSPVFAIAPESFKEVSQIVDDVFFVPDTMDILAPFCSSIVGQLFAYYIALERGCDIDRPRNLAKSVTVE